MEKKVSNLLDLKQISTIGDSGRFANTCYRDLLKAVPFKSNIPMAMSCRLPFKAPHDTLSQCMLMPHELFASIFHYYPETWKTCVLPSEERLEQFWQNNRSHPAMESSELQWIDGYRTQVVPISLHGDDVPITGVGKSWAQLMTVFSWNSMVGSGSTKDTQYLIYGCFDKLRAVEEDQSKDTLGCFFKMLTWSLRWLLTGLWPDRDHLGNV